MPLAETSAQAVAAGFPTAFSQELWAFLSYRSIRICFRKEDAKAYWCVKMLVKSAITDRLKMTREGYGLPFQCHSNLVCTFEHLIVCRSNCPMLKLLELLPLSNITMLFDIICQRGNLKWLKCICIPCAPCATFWSLKGCDSNPRVANAEVRDDPKRSHHMKASFPSWNCDLP